MGLERVGKVRLSKSGKALEVKIDKWPTSTFTWYCYVPVKQLRLILNKEKAETDISLLVNDAHANTLCMLLSFTYCPLLMKCKSVES